jgi:cobalt-zinc-cadmium efflux system membrane fusion protein
MISNPFFGLIAIVAMPVLVEANTNLGLTPADLERLGVDLQAPQTVTEAEVASGLAMVVIPPAQQAVVTSTVSGVLSRVLVAEGDVVTAGQPLAEIRSADLLQLQREFIEAAMRLELASAQNERDQGLYADGIIAERRVLESAAAENSATAILEQFRQQLLLAGLNDAELGRLRETRELSPDLTLRAPFAATVVNQHAALGAHIDAMDPVYRIADLSELWLELRVPQERADRIRPGMRIAVATADRSLSGEVMMMGRVADEATQTVLVRGYIDDEGGVLRAGQVLSARILGDGLDGSGVIAVPNSAVIRNDGSAFVFGSRGGGQIAVLPVEVLGDDGTFTYARGDFDSKVRIAVEGAAALKSVWLSAGEEGE